MPNFKVLINFLCYVLLFERWCCLLCAVLSVLSSCINSLASYSSEEYCKVLSQQTITLTLSVGCLLFGG